MKRLLIACTTIVLLVFGAFFGSYALAINAINTSQHHWCAALSLLTKQPVPKPADPQANPSRENAYEFYSHLKTLERQFHC